ncbi:MAG: transposase [Candidatus Wallbacteria bacterium]|nr:transposase [Candidatus Wallbacteria bacterium]
MERLLADRLQKIAEQDGSEQDRKARAEVAGLRSRLERARRADEELRARNERRESRGREKLASRRRSSSLFGKEHFRRHPDRNALICPAGQELGRLGMYPTENGRRRYQLYGRLYCTGCPLKERCTGARGRRVKVLHETPTTPTATVPTPAESPSPVTNEELKAVVNESKPNPDTESVAPPPSEDATAPLENGSDAQKVDEKSKKRGPVASLTDPEALMMLATSEKRWEPSFNADITVTGDGVIVSQFLTKNSTDYHSFAPALEFVGSTLSTPTSWVGDGHYGTAANLVLAARKNVNLYAPRSDSRAGADTNESLTPAPMSSKRSGTAVPEKIGRRVFRAHPDRDTLVCPAEQELRYLGEYLNDSGRGTYRLYGRSDCTGCALKEQCTRCRGRRVKVRGATPENTALSPNEGESSTPALSELDAALDQFEKRMKKEGQRLLKLRGQTAEPVNAQLKQHGLGRLHVRGLSRCGTVLTLGCTAHNVGKWRAMEAAKRLRGLAAVEAA